MSAELEGMTLSLSGVENAPETCLEWTLETLTDAPQGRFMFLDANGEPRLIVTAGELSDLQQRATAEALDREGSL